MELAAAAQIAPATASKVMRGEGVYRKTLTDVAHALGQKYYDLLEENRKQEEGRPADKTEQKRYKIHLIFIGKNKEDFDEDQLIAIAEKLNKLIGGSGDIDMEDIKSGSTIITVSLNETDMLRLLSVLELDPKKFERELGITRLTMDANTKLLLRRHSKPVCPFCQGRNTLELNRTLMDSILQFFLIRHYRCLGCSKKFWRFG